MLWRANSERKRKDILSSARISCLLDDQVDRSRQAIPVRQLPLELPAAGGCERVEFGHAAGLGLPPFGLDPGLLLEAMERVCVPLVPQMIHFGSGVATFSADEISMSAVAPASVRRKAFT